MAVENDVSSLLIIKINKNGTEHQMDLLYRFCNAGQTSGIFRCRHKQSCDCTLQADLFSAPKAEVTK